MSTWQAFSWMYKRALVCVARFWFVCQVQILSVVIHNFKIWTFQEGQHFTYSRKLVPNLLFMPRPKNKVRLLNKEIYACWGLSLEWVEEGRCSSKWKTSSLGNLTLSFPFMLDHILWNTSLICRYFFTCIFLYGIWLLYKILHKIFKKMPQIIFSYTYKKLTKLIK